MRVARLPIVFGAGLFYVAWTQLPAPLQTDAAVLQSNMAFSAAAKRKQAHAAPPNIVYGERPHVGGPADPSFGPDGRPYKVPEYLRNQCYIDEGYGRFSACNNRN
jgi:hypothetical protein